MPLPTFAPLKPANYDSQTVLDELISRGVLRDRRLSVEVVQHPGVSRHLGAPAPRCAVSPMRPQDQLHPAQVTEDALDRYCRQLEHLYNNGEPWPRWDLRLRPGPRPA